MKSITFYLYNPNDIGNVLSTMGIYDMNNIKRIEITKLDDNSNQCLIVVFLKFI